MGDDVRGIRELGWTPEQWRLTSAQFVVFLDILDQDILDFPPRLLAYIRSQPGAYNPITKGYSADAICEDTATWIRTTWDG